ncbi:MAG: hypothetical protein K6T88_04295 [Bacillus sp. (in: Bacteria)]|nr:hypothetical protein [Bacillus sp. (in: firmicutes)]
MLKKRYILLGLLLTSVLIVSACSDSETSTESKDTTEASAVNGEATPEEKKEEPKTDETDVKTNQNVNIIATDFKFNEKKYYIKSGEEATLKLTSKEGTHGIMVEGLNVSIDKPNGTVKFTPKEAGEYKILCSVFCGAGHGDMTATLVVVE